MHYEILETRKRQQEEEEAARSKSGTIHAPFVYNEQDFPSILQDLGSRYKTNDVDKKKRRKQEEDGKYLWIAAKGKHNSCVNLSIEHIFLFFLFKWTHRNFIQPLQYTINLTIKDTNS